MVLNPQADELANKLACGHAPQRKHRCQPGFGQLGFAVLAQVSKKNISEDERGGAGTLQVAHGIAH